MLYTYDPSMHDYSEDEPELVCTGHDHWVYGNKAEIERYKEIREKGEPVKSITIGKGEHHAAVVEEHDEAEEQFLKAPVHDTGSVWYKLLSAILAFFVVTAPLPFIGAHLFRRFNYMRNAKACIKGAVGGLIAIGVVLALFAIFLVLAVI